MSLLKRVVAHPAAAAKISCRLALVKIDSTAEKTRVALNKMPIETALALISSSDVLIWKSAQTGTISNTNIIEVTIKVTKVLMRVLV